MSRRGNSVLSGVHRRLAALRGRTLAARLAKLTAGVDGPVVLLLDGNAHNDLSTWVEAFGAARLTVLAEHSPVPHEGVRCVVVAGRREIDQELALLGACRIVVDEIAADPDKQLARWARFGLHVDLGGWYVVRAATSPLAWQAKVATFGEEVEPRMRAFLIESALHAVLAADHLLLPKRRRHVLRVNDRTADLLLPRRNPELQITTLASRPAELVTSRLQVFSHGPNDVFLPEVPFEAPRLTCQWYRGEVEARAQMLTISGATALPPSFRHAWAERPGNHGLADVGRRFAELPESTGAPALAGDYFDLNAAVPGHFGHVMTESLGKLWAWDEARRAIPGLQGLYRLPKGAEAPGFEATLFEAFGVPSDDIHWVTSDVSIESYVSPTVPWHNGRPFHFHPAVVDVWQRLRAALVIPGQATPERIFVSRGNGERPCRNQAEVEAWFAQRGFDVVFPERLSLPDQATLFANARVVAGFAGSALFNLLYAEHVDKVILLSHEQYSARNEWLYAVSVADELHYFWSEPETKAAAGVRWRASFHSTWSFDFERFGAELEQVVR